MHAGREGFNTEWRVSLLYDCQPDDSCKQAILIQPAGPAARIVTFPAPPQVRARGALWSVRAGGERCGP
jgi:hypothetical protein